MYDIAKKARSGMKAKAQRLAGEKDRKTDSSDWTPAPELNADVKTGMRPVSRRAYKSGGKVAGCATPTRADRKPRKAGGPVKAAEKGEQPLVDRYINRDLKKANEYRDGKKHVGALKHGGRAHKKNGGGTMSMEEMIEKNPAPKKEPLFKGPIPLPPRRKPDPVPPREPEKADPRLIKAAHGGRAKKADGGPMMMDPRLGMVKPKALEFGQNVVTPGLKKGGRVAKDDGGSIRQRFNAEFAKQRAAGAKKFTFEGKEYTTELAKPAKAPMGAMPGSSRAGAPPMGAGPGSRSAASAPPEGAGPGSTAPESEGFFTRMFRRSQEVSGETPYRKKNITVEFGPRPEQKKNQADWDAPGAHKKGGRVAKQIGGALGRAMPAMAMGAGVRPSMPTLPPQAMMGRPSMPALPAQAMANAQGVPMQTGTFMPPGLANPNPAMAPSMATPAVMPTAYADGGRIARALGGEASKKSKSKSQGKSNINIIISTGKAEKPEQPPMSLAAGQGQPPLPPALPAPMMGAGAPPPDAGMPPMGGPAAPPPMMPPMGPPMPRKSGGRVSKVAHSYKDMTAGSGSGEGRLQKTDIAKRGSKPAFEKGLNLTTASNYPNKVPGATGGRTARKAGGKIYRSYKDMDAGAGSGEGRLEKTEIQKRKK